MLRQTAALTLGALAILPTGLQSREDPSHLCRDAAATAARKTRVPYDVLLAISTVETGRNNQPWPWTVNFGGDGRWFDSARDAEASVAEAVDRGVTNIDLGCFQLNYRWHAEGFGSISDMLDPNRNAAYAAEFLAKQYSSTGDWALAAAAYHSATPEYAEAYKSRFEAAYAQTSGTGAQLPEAVATLRENRFPLLVAGSNGARGSLVPSASSGARLIGAQ